MKHIISCMLCLLLIFASSQAAVSVRVDDTAALLEADGRVIVAPDQWKDIVPLGNQWFAALSNGAYALMDDGGKLHTDFIYSDIRVAENMFIACRDGQWGLLDADGRETGYFAYQMIRSAGDGAFWALKGRRNDLESDELFLLDSNGGETATGLFVHSTGRAGDGMLCVRMPGSGLWGYCNSRGDIAIPAEYDYAGAFSGGIAVAVKGGKYGAIAPDGGTIVEFNFDYLEMSPSGMLIAQQYDQGVTVFSADGEEITRHEGEDIIAALAGNGYSVITGGRMFFFDENNLLLAQASQRASAAAGLNGQLIVSDGAWGEMCVYIAGTDALYQNIYPLGMAGDAPLYAYMDVHAARYMNDQLGEIQYAVDMENARYGLLDSYGTEIMPAQYESIEYLADDRLLVHIEGQWQMIDSSGRIYWTYGIRQSEEASF